MATHISLVSNHFRKIFGTHSPRPVSSSRLFSRPAAPNASSTSDLANEVQRLAAQLNQQGEAVSGLASAMAGDPAALEKTAAKTATSLLGGSILGELAGSATGGFSWQTLLKDVLPLSGLVSEIAGLFHSPHVPAPLEQYDAPISLGFSGVLGRDGGISQASGGEDGLARASPPGLDLTDAAGGAHSPYARRSDGSLGSVAGAPVSNYAGVLDLSSVVHGLTASHVPSRPLVPQAESDSPNSRDSKAPTERTSIESGGPAAVPAFDSAWFMDHASYIAAAVRNAMLDSHPILDVINDL